ncbi:tape measure protein, partial [Kistimonas scapharcae]|uniref:tape measure protein n=1 Tax=Kistimonas scapharcae TaxID=1036133 RepID=UPI0031EFAE89
LLLAGTGFYALKRAMTGVLSTGDQFERTAVQLKAVMGSVEDGEKAFAWIREFTQNTPLQLQDVTNAFVLLRNFGFDPTDGTMQSLVDMNAKLGGSQEKLQRITLQLGQAWGNQKLQYEEIKTLIENGVPVWDLLSQATGKNVTELRALSAQGKLGRDVIRGLIDAMGQSSQGAAADAMSLLSGYVSNLKDRWSEFANLIAESGWLDYIKDNLRQLNQSLETLDKNGKLKQ